MLRAESIVEGVYTGWKPLTGMSDVTPKGSWYHFYTLIIKNNLISISVSPSIIIKAKVFDSCSEGGFYTYKGEIFTKNHQQRVKMRIVDSCYVKVPKNGWPEIDIQFQKITEVGFSLDGVNYVLQGPNYKTND